VLYGKPFLFGSARFEYTGLPEGRVRVQTLASSKATKG